MIDLRRLVVGHCGRHCKEEIVTTSTRDSDFNDFSLTTCLGCRYLYVSTSDRYTTRACTMILVCAALNNTACVCRLEELVPMDTSKSVHLKQTSV